MRRRALLVAGCLATASAAADVIFDGSLGPPGSIAGDMEIGEQWGTRVGENLFHSFLQFNINAGESATFTADGTTSNVIGRVTGGLESLINGPLSSDIPGAALWLVNPSGIVFGRGAVVDVQGAFMASTADYLLLEDGGRFAASLEGESGTFLTMGDPTAFGFLGTDPAPISLRGSELRAAPGSQLGLIGGGIEVKNSQVVAQGGAINLVSVGGPGEIGIGGGAPDTGGMDAFGDLTLSGAQVDAGSENGGGAVYIQGGRFVMKRGSVVSSRTIDGDSGEVDINAEKVVIEGESGIDTGSDGGGNAASVSISASGEVLLRGGSFIKTVSSREGNSGDVSIKAGSLRLLNGSVVDTQARQRGDSGDITVVAEGDVVIRGGNSVNALSGFDARGGSFGSAGRIDITANNVSLLNRAYLVADNAFRGKPGAITINATDTIRMRNPAGNAWSNMNTNGLFGAASGVIKLNARHILMDSAGIASVMDDSERDGGAIILNATESLIMRNGSFIELTTRDSPVFGGTITINAGLLDMSGRSAISTNIFQARTRDPIGGAAGDIYINVNDLVMRESNIEAQVCGCASGAAGNIFVNATGSISISGVDPLFPDQGAGIRSTSWGGESGGNITITAGEIHLFDSGGIFSDSPGTVEELENQGFFGLEPGDAGNISVTANQLNLDSGGVINTAAQAAGGGVINLDIRDFIYLENASITAEAQGVTPDSGGGNVFIREPGVLVMNSGSIIASANAGNGGNIGIVTEVLIPSLDSVIDASSRRGVDGQVIIDSPNQQVTTTAVLDTPAFDAAELVSDPCVVQVDEKRSSLTLEGGASVAAAPDELQTCPVTAP